MPEVLRDQKLVRENDSFHNLLVESAERFPNIEQDFYRIFSHDPKLQTLLPFLAYAQNNTENAYKSLSDKIDLRNNQQPRFAVSSCCDAEGNCIHGVGNDGDRVNAALVLRTPDSAIRYDVKNASDSKNGAVLTYAAAALYDLARAKGINLIMHMRTSSSVFMEALYHAHKHGYETYVESFLADNESMRQFVTDHSVRKFIEKGADLYETVLTNGINHYEKLLVTDQYDREIASSTLTRYKTQPAEQSLDSRLIRCMEIQQLLDEREAIIQRGFDSENVIIVYQGQSSGHEYVFNPTLNRFIRIPNLDADNPNFSTEKEKFLSLLPQHQMWMEVASLLLQGARNYRQFSVAKMANIKNPKLVPNPLVVCCSDSRALPKFVIDTGANEMQVVLRNPGAFISREDKLLSDARRFLALASLLDESVIIAPHGNCGAQAAIDAYYEGDKNVPPAFEDLAKHRIDLMRVVLNKGELPDEAVPIQDLQKLYGKESIIKYYRDMSGIALATIGDCMAVQQLYWDIDVIQREFPKLHLVPVFQNMTECRNYAYNSQSKKFVAVPTVEPSALAADTTQKIAAVG